MPLFPQIGISGQPTAWNEIGFGGPASPRGYVRMDFDRRDPWEAAEAKPGAEAEARKANAAQCGAGGLQGSFVFAPLRALKALLLLSLARVLFDQGSAGAKDGGDGQEQSANLRAELLCDQAGDGRCQSPHDKPDEILMPTGLAKGRWTQMDQHFP